MGNIEHRRRKTVVNGHNVFPGITNDNWTAEERQDEHHRIRCTSVRESFLEKPDFHTLTKMKYYDKSVEKLYIEYLVSFG